MSAPDTVRPVHDGPGHPYGDIAWCGGCLAEYLENRQKERDT